MARQRPRAVRRAIARSRRVHGPEVGSSLCRPRGHEGVDLLIAATALEHGLTVVTRNVRHLEPTGVPMVDPSGRAPSKRNADSTA